jgi:hypothetical protein
MDRPRPVPIRLRLLALIPILALPLLHIGCRGCQDPDPAAEGEVTPSPYTLAGTFDTGALAPTSPGPWNIGIALFDEVAFDPTTLEALDEPSLWETFTTDALPGTFSVDLGASFTGWVLVILDEDGSGLPGTPEQGDLLAVSPALVTSPAIDLRLYLEETWER